MTLKVDMSKAYDSVEWGFLEEVILRLGFDVRWVGWVMECVRTVWYTLIVNDKPSDKIVLSRGIRRGSLYCPIYFCLSWMFCLE